jgi:hypothetical protein
VAYSVVSDVRSIVDTDIEDAEITNIITWVDAVIDLRINAGAAGAVYLENLSATYAAYRCMLKDPEARSLGEYSEDRSKALELLKDDIDFLFALADGGINFIATRSELS